MQSDTHSPQLEVSGCSLSAAGSFNFTKVILLLLVLSLHSIAWEFSSGINVVEASDSVPIDSIQDVANATVLSAIEIKVADNETKVHLKADGVIRNYTNNQLKKDVEADRPDRMYLDLKNVNLAGPIPALEVGTALARVRAGQRDYGARVVFDSSLEELFGYTIQEQSDGLLITIREPSAGTVTIANAVQTDLSGSGPQKATETAADTIFPEPQAAGDLNIVIVMSDSADYAQEWLETPSENNHGFRVLKEVGEDQEFTASFLVTGLNPDSYGNYSYVVSYSVLNALGKPIINRRNYSLAAGKASTHPVFVLVEPQVGLSLDSSNPAGDYTIIGMVQDLTNNKVARASRKITLIR